MNLSFRRTFGVDRVRVAVAIAVVVLTANVEFAGADDGYVLPRDKVPFYNVPSQGKPIHLLLSAYPFPDEEPAVPADEPRLPEDELKAFQDELSDSLDRLDRLDELDRKERRRGGDKEDDGVFSLSDDDEDLEDDYDDEPLFKINQDRLARIEDGRFVLPPLEAVSVDTSGIGNGRIPENFRDMHDVPARMLPESGSERYLDSKPWNWTVAHWRAANTFSFPRYFEDRMLERHGHERFPGLQPFASGFRFAATVPMLPYLMTLSPPKECESTLGYFRPGSCAPTMHQQPPYSNRALAAEAAAITAGILIFP